MLITADEPELRAIAKIAAEAHRSIGGDRTQSVQDVGDTPGRHADIEREPVGAQCSRGQFALQQTAWMNHGFSFHALILPLFVTTGLDPVVHADLSTAWIAGSSPAMTKPNTRARLELSGCQNPSTTVHSIRTQGADLISGVIVKRPQSNRIPIAILFAVLWSGGMVLRAPSIDLQTVATAVIAGAVVGGAHVLAVRQVSRAFVSKPSLLEITHPAGLIADARFEGLLWPTALSPPASASGSRC